MQFSLLAPSSTSSVFVDAAIRLLAIVSIAIGSTTAHAGDDRFGFATHFEQVGPPRQ